MKAVEKSKIRQKGIMALKKSLGIVGAIRFIQDLNEGNGNYTKDRSEWLENPTIDEVFSEIKGKRKR